MLLLALLPTAPTCNPTAKRLRIASLCAYVGTWLHLAPVTVRGGSSRLHSSSCRLRPPPLAPGGG